MDKGRPIPSRQTERAKLERLADGSPAVSEREMLESTVTGVVSVLTDVIGLANPLLRSRASSVRQIVHHLAAQLGIRDVWKLEMAAMLSRIGCVAVPPAALERYLLGQSLEPGEERVLRDHPEIAYRLLSRIPRLGDVAEMVRRQRGPRGTAPTEEIARGAAIVRLAQSFDTLLVRGQSVVQARRALARVQPPHPPELLEMLAGYTPLKRGERRSIGLAELRPGMSIDEDVRAENGVVIVSRGHEVSHALIDHLWHFSERIGLEEPLIVRDALELGYARASAANDDAGADAAKKRTPDAA